MLKYHNIQLAFQEVPDEITLAINIVGCPHHCDGCHSPWLREDKGIILDENAIYGILQGHDGFSCICFMGGDKDKESVNHLAKYIRDKYPKMHIAFYSGDDVFSDIIDKHNFDYIKIGHYDNRLGGLDSPTTNQTMFKIHNDGNIISIENITHEFWKNKKV